MPYISIDSKNFDHEVINSDIPVLIDFFATWCGPCKMLSPVIDQLADEFSGRVKIGKVDIDVSPDLASKYQVMSVPTLLFIKNGEVVEQVSGVKTKDEIIEMISK